VHEITSEGKPTTFQSQRVTVTARKVHDVELKLITLAEAAIIRGRWAQWTPWTGLVAASPFVCRLPAGALYFVAARTSRATTRVYQLPCSSAGCSRGPINRAKLNAQLPRAGLEQKIAVGGYIAGARLIANASCCST